MELKPFISSAEIEGIVGRLAAELSADFKGRRPVLVGVLNGAFIFISDLARKLDIEHEIDFIQTSCYGLRDIPSDEVIILREITSDIRGRDVIIVEDIVDRGHTGRALRKYFASRGAQSVKICTLLRREGGCPDLKVDYTGAAIGKGFVVGYGMDYREGYRGLAALYLLE
ncbi:MAG TPA: phosphoribosyltransferase family protein [Thermodesulfobacteriota bacterium]